MIRLFLILLTLCWLNGAQARCGPWMSGGGGLNTFTINFPQGMNQIEVAMDQAAFTPLGGWSPFTLVSNILYCGGGDNLVGSFLDDEPSAPVKLMLDGNALSTPPVGYYSEGGVSYPVYPAWVGSLVGFAIRYSLGGPAPVVVGGTAASFTPQPRQIFIDGYFSARLIKISPYMMDYYIPPSQAYLWLGTHLSYEGLWHHTETVTGASLVATSGIFMKRRTCNMAGMTIVPVSLPAISSQSLPASGSVAGRVPFSLEFYCPDMPNSNMYITFTDNTNPGNTSTILSLAPESTAKDIGLQILYNNQPVGFGADSSEAGNTNQFWLSNMSAGYKTFSFGAQYIRPGNTPVTAGSVVARATFTMSYQ